MRSRSPWAQHILRCPAGSSPPDLSAPVAVVVPKVNLSADSSQTIAALSPVDPLSIMIPASFELADIPVCNSIRLSSITVFVVLIVDVAPSPKVNPVYKTHKIAI